MADYQQVLQFLEAPQLAVQVAAGRIQLPLDLTVPFRHYGFPPALLPLWSTGAIYHGYWKHWLSPRKITIVELDVAQKRRAHEVARNFPQLIRQMTLFDICWNEEVTATVRASARETDISDQEIEQMARAVAVYGDHPDGWLTLPSFAEGPPLPCVPDGKGYHGDFPFEGMALTKENVRHICTFEADEVLRREIVALPFAPPWFLTDEQAPVFKQFMEQGDYAGAWMSLNSTGWLFAEAKAALKELGERVDVPGFGLLVDAWTGEAHGAAPVTADGTHY